MLNKFFKLSFTVFGIFTSFFLQKVDAYTSPYASAKVAYAVNYCANEFGIFNDAESFNNINRYMKNNHNMGLGRFITLHKERDFGRRLML